MDLALAWICTAIFAVLMILYIRSTNKKAVKCKCGHYAAPEQRIEVGGVKQWHVVNENSLCHECFTDLVRKDKEGRLL